jgi:MOSC domain-containing protein YiiM
MSAGSILAITTAPEYGADLVARQSIELIAGGGLPTDRHAGARRAVTIVCTGELARAAAQHGVDSIDGVMTRRNIVVDLPELPRQHGTRFTLGEAVLEVWRDCAPCELMDEFFGEGARHALKQRAGISATVIEGGTISVGDVVQIPETASQ